MAFGSGSGPARRVSARLLPGALARRESRKPLAPSRSEARDSIASEYGPSDGQKPGIIPARLSSPSALGDSFRISAGVKRW